MNPHDRPSTHPRSTANGTGRASHLPSPDVMDAWQKIVGGDPASNRKIRDDRGRLGRARGRLGRALRALLGQDASRSAESPTSPTSRDGSSPISLGIPFPGTGIPGPGFLAPRTIPFFEDLTPPPPVRRQILPLSSESHILPNKTVQITARPQMGALRPERLLIGSHPERWVVNEIKVGNSSQLMQSGDLPGRMFAYDAVDCSLSLDTIQMAMDFVLVVTYVGNEKDGEPFVANLIGTSVERESLESFASPFSPLPIWNALRDDGVYSFSTLGADPVRIAPSHEARPGVLRTIVDAARGAISTLADAARRALSDQDPSVASKTEDDRIPAWRFAPPPPVAFAPREIAPARRSPLPMSSGTPVLPNMSAQLTVRPQTYAFRPERIVIDNPGDWIVNDILVGSRSQFAQRGDVPGEAFAHNAIDCLLHLDTVQTAMDFVLVVTYVGDDPKGAQFLCGVLGTTAF